jgi:hypothetical protein
MTQEVLKISSFRTKLIMIFLPLLIKDYKKKSVGIYTHVFFRHGSMIV